MDAISRFENMLSRVKREGIGDLLAYLRSSDFYTAPASTRYHLSCEGGLLQHSLHVLDCLMAKRKSPIWKPVLEKVPDDSVILVALLHDLCKIDFYTQEVRNKKTYDKEALKAAASYQVKHDRLGDYVWESVIGYRVCDQLPLGHGEKSVIIAQRYIKLSIEEVMAIRWHMGFSEEKAYYQAVGEAMEKFPLVLALHEADLEATKLLEVVV